MVIVPWAFAVATVPHIGNAFHQTSRPTLIKVIVFGFGWGVGSTLFGLGISRVGIALGFAIILGITASVRSLLPLAVLHLDQLWARQGQTLTVGLLLVIAGVSLCSISGHLRERGEAERSGRAGRLAFGVGLFICVLSGIFSSMLNFSFVFGKELQQFTLAAGSSLTMSSNLVWTLALGAGFVANAGYCAYLLGQNHGWAVFTGREVSTSYWLGGVIMGAIWFSGIAVYGMGAARLGTLGGIVGWPLFMTMIIITGNLWGAVTGEWAGASRRSYAYSWSGVAVLLVAIYVISLVGGQ